MLKNNPLVIKPEEMDEMISRCRPIEGWEQEVCGMDSSMLGIRVFEYPDHQFIRKYTYVDKDNKERKSQLVANGFAYWDPRFSEWRILLSQEGMRHFRFVLMHELLHIIDGHVFVQKPKPILWLYCQDAWINELLKRSGIEVPEGSVTAELLSQAAGRELGWLPPAMYYAIFDDEQEDDGRLAGSISDVCIPTDDPLAIVKARKALSDLAKALGDKYDMKELSRYLNHKVAGTTPGEADFSLKDVQIKIPGWYQSLLQHLSREWDYRRARTWRRDGRMPFLPSAGRKMVILPKRALVAIDVSGSMSDEEIFWLTALSRRLSRDVKGEVVYFDTRIVHRAPLGSPITKLHGGRGGTDYGPVVEYARNKGKGAVLIMCTDGYPVDWPSIKGLKVALVCTTDAKIGWKCPVFRTGGSR